MDEKKSIKISGVTVLLIITIMIIVCMAYYMYIERVNANTQIATLEQESIEMQNTINDLQGKINSISNTINSDTDNEETKFSDTEIKQALTSYLNIFKGHGEPFQILVLLGLAEYGEYLNPDRTADNYVKTDIKYSDFKAAVMNYVTEECFNRINNNEKLGIVEFKEQDGLLYYFDGGWSGTEYEVESITLKGDYSDSTYIAKVYRINLNYSKELENIEFTIADYNGKCVISYCD